MKEKWKRFAISQVLGDYSHHITAAALYDRLLEAEDAEIDSVFEKFGVAVSEPYDNLPGLGVVCAIVEMATRAEQFETFDCNLSEGQVKALHCAMADLIGAVQVHRAQDPFVVIEEDAVLQTIDELISAFPEVKFDTRGLEAES